jgi:hypothetical protein
MSNARVATQPKPAARSMEGRRCAS